VRCQEGSEGGEGRGDVGGNQGVLVRGKCGKVGFAKLRNEGDSKG